MSLLVLRVRQVNGTRLIAVSPSDAQRVRRDRTQLDSITAEAALDVSCDGSRSWVFPFGCDNTPEGKAAIRNYLRGNR